MNLFKFYYFSHLFFWAVMLSLLLIMNILIVITLTVDLLVAHCYMSCSVGVSFHPTFSPAKWLSLPVTRRWCLWERGQSAPHSTGWQPQSQPCSCCASLKKASVSSYKFADVISFPSNRPESQSCLFLHLLLPSLHTSLRACWKGFLSIWKPAGILNKVTAVRCSQVVKTQHSLEMRLYQTRTLLFSRYELFLINSFQKGERKAKFVWSQGWWKLLAEQPSRLCALRKEQESTKRESWMWFSLQRQVTLLLMPVLRMIFWKTGSFAGNMIH